jgi:hypothetical protein
MLRPKEFLEQELANVTLSLQEALRYDYGAHRSYEFYDECLFRLSILKDELERAEPTNAELLASIAINISNLSELITRIERSHLGEFSWPFADALRSTALKICQSGAGAKQFNSPLFYISADGGLAAYRVHAEQEEPDTIETRIFNIVFPRSLKYHVLLHAILGHELGHAAWTIPDLRKAFLDDVVEPLIGESCLSSEKRYRSWLQRQFHIRIRAEDADEIIDNWKEEFFCDLFGLVVMGPSFSAAHKSLLSATDITGEEPGSTHPPHAIRYWMLDVAAKTLQFNKHTPRGSGKLRQARSAFWSSLGSSMTKNKIFKVANIQRAVTALRDLLKKQNNAAYEFPSTSDIEEAFARLCSATPPVLHTIDDSDSLRLRELDYRTILYVGWLAWHAQPKEGLKLSFLDINRLCDKSILQQQAIGLAIPKKGLRE